MDQLTEIAVDTSKSLFTLHGVDREGRTILARNVRRGQFEAFFAKLAPVRVAMEACGGAHHWARRLTALGHKVRLIPPQYVKPFVKRSKTDRADAQAISDAAARPGMREVAVKSAEQQADAMILSVRELLVRQRTQLTNALRGHAQEFGLLAAKHARGLSRLLEAIATAQELPEAARHMLVLLGEQVAHLDAEISKLDTTLKAQHKAHAMSRLLAQIPGVGPITALSMARRVDAGQFKSGRHFAAWLGLTPREHSSGGKRRLGGISRAGNAGLRCLLVVGATAVINTARPGARGVSSWLVELLKRRPRKLAAVALANKMARTIWAMMTSGEAYRRASVTA